MHLSQLSMPGIDLVLKQYSLQDVGSSSIIQVDHHIQQPLALIPKTWGANQDLCADWVILVGESESERRRCLSVHVLMLNYYNSADDGFRNKIALTTNIS